MPNKRDIKRSLARINRIKTWQLVVMLLLVSLLAASLLRLNNLGMVERRDAVIAADKSGDKQQIKQSLLELQHYVTSHMNTDLGSGVYLVSSYERDRAAALEAASDSTNPNSKVYQQASIECRSRFQGGVESFRNDYVQCVIDRVSSLRQQDDAVASIGLPKADTYRYDFASPLWSLDLAGITVAIGVVIALIIIARMVTVVLLRLLLRRHFANV